MPVPSNFQLPSTVQRLFQTADPWGRPGIKIAQKGSLIAFKYQGQLGKQIHDPYPLVLVSDIFTDMIRGVNLHYLTLPTIKGIVRSYANTQFSYAFIKNSQYIVSAFRSYKRTGITQLKMLDASFLQNLLSAVRALNPNEIEQIRGQVHRLMQQAINQPTADQMNQEGTK